jgi:hypothetical protein
VQFTRWASLCRFRSQAPASVCAEVLESQTPHHRGAQQATAGHGAQRLMQTFIAYRYSDYPVQLLGLSSVTQESRHVQKRIGRSRNVDSAEPTASKQATVVLCALRASTQNECAPTHTRTRPLPALPSAKSKPLAYPPSAACSCGGRRILQFIELLL